VVSAAIRARGSGLQVGTWLLPGARDDHTLHIRPVPASRFANHVSRAKNPLRPASYGLLAWTDLDGSFASQLCVLAH
jgi:hypothetical protein